MTEAEMKQAKWLLLLAVGILMVLPGCKSMNPMVKSDVRVAAGEEIVPIGTWAIMANNTPQTQIGTAEMYWQYDYYDATKQGNDAFVNLQLGVKYVTYSPDYPIEDAHLNITADMPTERGAPGLYNFNWALQTPYPDDYTRIFLIPVASLYGIPWECGGYLWFLMHVGITGGPTAMVGEFVDANPWFNRLYVQVVNPPPPPPPEERGFKTYTQGGWGAPPKGGNPGVYLHANFDAAFGIELVVGGGYTLTLTSAQAVTNYLPDGSTPRALTRNYTDPKAPITVLGGQVVALALNVGFDLWDPNFGLPAENLAHLKVADPGSPFYGWTVAAVLAEANAVLGGGGSHTPAQLNECCTEINENFDGGNVDGGFLEMP
jgi:hypothetical protein